MIEYSVKKQMFADRKSEFNVCAKIPNSPEYPKYFNPDYAWEFIETIVCDVDSIQEGKKIINELKNSSKDD